MATLGMSLARRARRPRAPRRRAGRLPSWPTAACAVPWRTRAPLPGRRAWRRAVPRPRPRRPSNRPATSRPADPRSARASRKQTKPHSSPRYRSPLMSQIISGSALPASAAATAVRTVAGQTLAEAHVLGLDQLRLGCRGSAATPAWARQPRRLRICSVVTSRRILPPRPERTPERAVFASELAIAVQPLHRVGMQVAVDPADQTRVEVAAMHLVERRRHGDEARRVTARLDGTSDNVTGIPRSANRPHRSRPHRGR